MKKSFICLTSVIALLSVATACTEEIDYTPADELREIIATADNFIPETDSRAFSIINNSVEFTWANGDTIGIFPDKGAQAYFPINVSGEESNKASFTGGGWALKPSSTYAAYYPFIGNFYIDKEDIPVSYVGQKQTGNASMAHLSAFDYMAASATTPASDKVNFHFKHLGSFVQIQITIPQGATIKSLTLSADEPVFVTEGKIDLTEATPTIKSVTKSKTITLEVENVTTTAENPVATLYMMLAPVDLSNKKLNAIVKTPFLISDSITLTSKNFEVGKAYGIKGTVSNFQISDMDAIEAKMADAYYSLRTAWGRRYHEVMSLTSDEFTSVSFDGDFSDYNYSNPTLHKSSPDDACVRHWVDAASGITKCNDIIMQLGGEDSPAAAQALALRAFYHFILMDSYGDVPLLNHMPKADEIIERAPRADVACFIEKDLLKAIPNLTTVNDASTYGKPNRWMAEALLVKLYINWAVYTCGDITKYTPSAANEKLNDCIAHCDEIIKSAIFDVGKGYRVKFMPENGVHINDFIYAMPFDAKTTQGMTYGRFNTWKSVKNNLNSYYGEKLTMSAAGIFAINPEMSNLFCLEGDERNECIIGGEIKMHDPVTRKATSTPWLYNGSPVVLTKDITLKEQSEQLNVGKDVNGWSQGYRSVKWWITAADYNYYGRNQSNDVPIFRYADVLLTKAEAIIRGGTATNGDSPASLMNQVRACAGAPSVTGTPTLKDLLDERGRELFDENWRRNDLIRFGNFEDDWGVKHLVNPSAKTNFNARILPIPTEILNENANWKQNLGY